MKLDTLDRRILSAIDANANASFAEIGLEAGASKETTNNRVKRLEERGIISTYSALVNFCKLGFTGYGVFAELKNSDRAIADKITKALIKNDSIYWLASLCGKYDLVFGLSARNVFEFDEIYSKIQEKFKEHLKYSDIAIRLDVTRFGKHYLTKKKQKRRQYYLGRKLETETIDDLDREILNILTKDARISTTDLAEVVDFPRSTVQSRIKSLENREIIQGYIALSHPEHYDYQVHQLLVTVYSKSESQRQEFFQFCQEHPNIVYFIRTVGKWDFELTCDLADAAELQELLLSMRERFSGYVDTIESLTVFNYHLKYGFTS